MNNSIKYAIDKIWRVEEQPPRLHRKEYSFLELFFEKFQYNIRLYCLLFMTNIAIGIAIALQIGEVGL